MTLRGRLTTVAATAVAVSIALVAVVVFYGERQETRDQIDQELQRQAAVVADALAGAADLTDLPGDVPGAALAAAQVLTRQGEVIPLLPGTPALPVPDRARAVAGGSGHRFSADVDVDGDRLRVLTVPFGEGALQVAQSTQRGDRHLLHLAGLLAFVTVGGITLAVLLGRLVAGAALRPVSRLTAGVERVAATLDLSRPVPVDGRDELGRLGASFNTMLAALRTSHESQRHLVADASHELRTPLASLRTNVEVLEDASDLAPEERARLVADVRAEVEGLVATVDDLLELARDEWSLAEEDLALDRVVERAVAWAGRRQPRSRFEARLSPLTVRADPAQTERAIANLLDNAAKWNGPGAAVEVAVEGDVLSVRDHGPGIDPADLPHVFERFWRSPAARQMPGAGLGLAIVRQVADAHGWQVTAENADGGGARFSIRFPADSSHGLRPGSPASHAGRGNSSAIAGDGKVTGRRWVSTRRLAILAAAAAPGLLAFAAWAVTREPATVRLTTVGGTLEHCGSQFCIDGTVVDFGPPWYLAEAVAPHDFDGDGQRSRLVEEILGLVGTRVTLETDGGRLDADVFTVNGLPFRSRQGELPPPRPAPDPGDAAMAQAGPLTTLTGSLERCGDWYCVASTRLAFGPGWYVERARSPHDFDGDGTTRTVAEELGGLLRRQVTLEVRAGPGQADVMVVNGLAYRQPEDAPPWWGGPLRCSGCA